MSELDEMWSRMLNEAMNAARSAGRHDVADYLDLKARNDALRQAGVQWLFEASMAIAGEANRGPSAISIEREEPHKFDHRGANLSGSKLTFRHGVRCITLEAGWTRTPADGFMRGGALAAARMSHFGMSRMDTELLLKPSGDRAPGWLALYRDGASVGVDEAFLRQHFALLAGE